MCIFRTELWNICTICPSVYWLVSFINCVSYSAGIFISCLMFLCLECLPTVGEIQYCVFCWIMVYMLCISAIQCSWFSVYFGFMNVFPFVFKLLNQKNLENPKNLILLYWDCVDLFSCSLGTIFGTNKNNTKFVMKLIILLWLHVMLWGFLNIYMKITAVLSHHVMKTCEVLSYSHVQFLIYIFTFLSIYNIFSWYCVFLSLLNLVGLHILQCTLPPRR